MKNPFERLIKKPANDNEVPNSPMSTKEEAHHYKVGATVRISESMLPEEIAAEIQLPLYTNPENQEEKIKQIEQEEHTLEQAHKLLDLVESPNFIANYRVHEVNAVEGYALVSPDKSDPKNTQLSDLKIKVPLKHTFLAEEFNTMDTEVFMEGSLVTIDEEKIQKIYPEGYSIGLPKPGIFTVEEIHEPPKDSPNAIAIAVVSGENGKLHPIPTNILTSL